MKKSGIISLYDLGNYGNRLQNYAVCYIIKSLGFKTQNCLRQKKVQCIKTNIKYILKGQIPSVKRCVKFKSFDMRYSNNIYAFSHKKKKALNYDYYICGSDQIWNPEFAGESFYFAPFAPPEKRIAYAASFGVSEIPENRKEEYKKYLSEMKAISVREESGAKIVKDLTGRDAVVLVDPTMMLDKVDWQKVSKKPRYHKEQKYILTYFLGKVSEERKSYIENIAKTKGYKIINLEGKSPNKYWYSTGPDEFIWLIEHCEAMLTDSFHGTVFSVLMDVPFIVFDREDNIGEMSSRIDTLLSTLKLEDRRFDNQVKTKVFEKNYSHIPEILEHERKKALSFLRTAMELD